MGKKISILGSTGSVGQSTLELIRSSGQFEGELENRFEIVCLTAHSNIKKLAEQALEFRPHFVAIKDESKAGELKSILANTNIKIISGEGAIIEAAQIEADLVMAAIVGAAGLEPTLAAARQGAKIALANKECLVCAGDLFLAEIKKSGAKLLPVDSEHNAIFQVLNGNKTKDLRRIILTASGGPFRQYDCDKLKNVSKNDALSHPVWDMGAKISIDSATLMNKGLELIEASLLFDCPSEMIDIIIHPQSIIHSMVEFIDGSVLAQMGVPDMKTPIAYTLGWPERMQTEIASPDFAKLAKLEFFAPDTQKFPALRLARNALESGGNAPNVLNAANEEAVTAFLDEKLDYLSITDCIERVLEQLSGEQAFNIAPTSIEEVLEMDKNARRIAIRQIEKLKV